MSYESVAEHMANTKPPARTYSPDRARDRLLLLRDLLEPERRGELLAQNLIPDIPVRRPESGVELAVLPGEILVVQMEPVVFFELPGEHRPVVHRRVRNAGVIEREHHGVIPRQFVRRGVHRDRRRLLEKNDVGVAAVYFLENGSHLRAVDALDANVPRLRLGRVARLLGNEKRSAPIVEEPFFVPSVGEDAIGEAVRLKMVRLREIHRHEKIRAGRRRERARSGDRRSDRDERAHRERDFPRCVHFEPFSGAGGPAVFPSAT